MPILSVLRISTIPQSVVSLFSPVFEICELKLTHNNNNSNENEKMNCENELFNDLPEL